MLSVKSNNQDLEACVQTNEHLWYNFQSGTPDAYSTIPRTGVTVIKGNNIS
jgi:hypothetical protein